MKVRLWWTVCVLVLTSATCALFIWLQNVTPPPVANALGLVLEIGASKHTIAPPDSATAGSTWIEFAVTYKNLGQHSVWLNGYSVDKVFHELETRFEKRDTWAAYGAGYCGTGAQMLEIHPGESHNFTVALPEQYRGQEFRVLLNYYASASAREATCATSLAREVTGTE